MARKTGLWYAVLAIAIVTMIGILGYQYGFLGFIYSVAMPKAFSNFNIILLSVIMGTAAFFSPCAFTVLPAFVSQYISKGEKSDSTKRALYFGFLAALGVIAVNLAVGLVIALLGQAAPFHKDPRDDISIVLGIRIAAGFVIAILGFILLLGKSVRIPILSKLGQTKNFSKSFFMHGVLYNSAALGCTGPILLGLMLFALTSGSFATAMLAFVVFSFTMGILMVVMTLLISAFKNRITAHMAKALPVIKYVAAVVMIVAGLAIAILTMEGNNLFVDIFFPYLT